MPKLLQTVNGAPATRKFSSADAREFGGMLLGLKNPRAARSFLYSLHANIVQGKTLLVDGAIAEVINLDRKHSLENHAKKIERVSKSNVESMYAEARIAKEMGEKTKKETLAWKMAAGTDWKSKAEALSTDAYALAMDTGNYELAEKIAREFDFSQRAIAAAKEKQESLPALPK